jgi:hypothetical protein
MLQFVYSINSIQASKMDDEIMLFIMSNNKLESATPVFLDISLFR